MLAIYLAWHPAGYRDRDVHNAVGTTDPQCCSGSVPDQRLDGGLGGGGGEPPLRHHNEHPGRGDVRRFVVSGLAAAVVVVIVPAGGRDIGRLERGCDLWHRPA